MSNELFDFSPSSSSESSEAEAQMTSSQRAQIRKLFDALGVPTAREQFAMVGEITGVNLKSVAQLDGSTANVLIQSLRGRVARLGSARTGNAWVDRNEDTWIDRL